MNRKTTDLRRLTALSLLAALVAVLACLGNFIKIGPFPITLTLSPIIIGAALYGPSAGAILGGVFGIVTMITGILGWDGGAFMMLVSSSAFGAVVVCVMKGVAAGWIAGLVYKAVSGVKRRRFGEEICESTDKDVASNGGAKKGSSAGGRLAVILAGIACPLTNTGLFLLAMLTVFRETLAVWAGGSDILVYAITGLTGINFLIELAVNLILSSSITMVIQYALKRK